MASIEGPTTGASSPSVNTQHPVVDGAGNTTSTADWSPEDKRRGADRLAESGAAYATLPTWVFLHQGLPDCVKVTLAVMTSVATGSVVAVSQADLAKRLGVSRQAMHERLTTAEQHGLIERQGRTWRLVWGMAPTIWPGGGRQPQPDNVNPDLTTERQPQPDNVNPDLTNPRARARVSVPSTSTSTSVSVSHSSKEKSVTKPLDGEERLALHRQFDPMFPHPDAVEETIDTALSHKAAVKWKTEYGYVRNWLRRASRESREHVARMATEKARLERARTPYRPAVTEPEPLKLTNIRDIVGQPTEAELAAYERDAV